MSDCKHDWIPSHPQPPDVWQCSECGERTRYPPTRHTDLDELQALCDAASPGPLEAVVTGLRGPDSEIILYGPRRGHDRALILAARTALPDLISEVRRLREREAARQPQGPAPEGRAYLCHLEDCPVCEGQPWRPKTARMTAIASLWEVVDDS